ncbi:Hypothetical_protein [Hexamita inflata]|uniref:Hypothetical_protein n=1 Tax=Hexamita inflata TaxID=28002 RepID=A0AA86REL4_9EUKA|nr:Hypothetical protein HINF_LOCUS58509 [Hexamita inflata]
MKQLQFILLSQSNNRLAASQKQEFLQNLQNQQMTEPNQDYIEQLFQNPFLSQNQQCCANYQYIVQLLLKQIQSTYEEHTVYNFQQSMKAIYILQQNNICFPLILEALIYIDQYVRLNDLPLYINCINTLDDEYRLYYFQNTSFISLKRYVEQFLADSFKLVEITLQYHNENMTKTEYEQALQQCKFQINCIATHNCVFNTLLQSFLVTLDYQLGEEALKSIYQLIKSLSETYKFVYELQSHKISNKKLLSACIQKLYKNYDICDEMLFWKIMCDQRDEQYFNKLTQMNNTPELIQFVESNSINEWLQVENE